jgi:glyoxylase-like metal-dependent hydrolase (beta-lactamase superfamily II)
MTEPPAVAEPAVPFDLGSWREIRSGVYVAMAEPESVNLGLIVGSQRTLLVDAGSSPDQGRTLRESVSVVTDKPLAGVVVTHWHYDHAFGLAAFADLPRIAHESVRARLGSPEAAAEAKRLGVAPEELAAPDTQIAVAMAIELGAIELGAIELGERRVEIVHLGRGHTDGDLVIVVPDADVLFVGDLIESAGPPSFGPDSVPEEWPATLDGVIGLMTASTLAVPGHGEPVDREFVFTQRGQIGARAAELGKPRGRELPLV